MTELLRAWSDCDAAARRIHMPLERGADAERDDRHGMLDADPHDVLDFRCRLRKCDAIRRLRLESGIAMVVVEQNANLAFSLVDTATVLETGRNVLTGSAAELKGMDEIRRAYLRG